MFVFYFSGEIVFFVFVFLFFFGVCKGWNDVGCVLGIFRFMFEEVMG